MALLDAAQALFFERPWEGITLGAVAGRAGVTKQTLLRHFGSKEGLLEAAFERAMGEVRSRRMAVPGDDIEEAVDNLLDHYDDRGWMALRMGRMESEAAQRMERAARQLHRDWVDHAFVAWLRGRERTRRRAALIALCDVQTWAILSRDLGMPRREVRATLLVAIRRLLQEAP